MAKFNSSRILRPRRSILQRATGIEAGWASAGGGPYPSNIVITGHTYHLYGNQDYLNPWMLQYQYISLLPRLRCEVRPGYSGLLTDDPNVSQRAAFANDEEYQPFDTDIWTSIAFMIPVGEPNQVTSANVATGSWFNILEWRHTADVGDASGLVSPMQLVWIDENRLRLTTRGSNTDPLLSTPAQTVQYNTTSFTRGDLWYWVSRHKWSPSGSGELEVWLGKTFPLPQIVNATGFALGYNDVNGPTFRFLAYRGLNPGPQGTDTQVVYFANPEWSTTSLADRINTPQSP